MSVSHRAWLRDSAAGGGHRAHTLVDLGCPFSTISFLPKFNKISNFDANASGHFGGVLDSERYLLGRECEK